ncbi:MAG: FixH family protein [Pseudomonadota bacterium]
MAPLTGPKVLMIALAAFGIIITVNFTLAYKAVATFPGIEAKNSYAVSQVFQADRDAQLALQWYVAARYGEGVLEIDIATKDGAPAEVVEMVALVGWATSTRDDVTPEFTRKGATYATPLNLIDGNWNVRLKAVAPDGTEFRQRIPLYVKNGQS